MPGTVTTAALDPILRAVSRSIFLTLQVAPRATRRQLGVGYLFCRTADTIADTRLLPREARLETLRLFRAQLERGEALADDLRRIAERVGPPQAIAEEKLLLERLPECFAAYASLDEGDRGLLRRLVTTLTRGMEMDLERFPPEESGEVAALESDADLDLYTYYVAGCVGEFWTDLQLAHLPALRSWEPRRMRELGVRFGKALQMTNILRDLNRDLAIGRVYFPRTRLEAARVTPRELREGRGRDKLKPILRDLLGLTLEHYRAGWEYTLAIPRRLPRLRLACAWPLLIGLRTLALLAGSPDPYAPGAHLKVTRREVRAIVLRSAVRVGSNRWLDRMFRQMERGVVQCRDRG
jgi:farnesyl-diphosphate farnesyltransferase